MVFVFGALSPPCKRITLTLKYGDKTYPISICRGATLQIQLCLTSGGLTDIL